MVLDAPAKVNLHLEIRGLRSDGYHEILSIVQSVSLSDRVRIRSLKEKEVLKVRCDPPVTAAKNIALAAAEAFRDACGLDSGLEIFIEKKIPVGAGLAGGSSDAAAVLRGLNRLCSSPLSPLQLGQLAARLGSDVPFFLHKAAALITGRGETIRELKPRADLHLLMVYPGFPVSTTEAYRWFDMDREQNHRSVTPEDLKVQFEDRAPQSWAFFNSFQATIERRYPVIMSIRKELEESGARPALLSGSGSSVVGVFTESRVAQSGFTRMRSSYPEARLLVPLQSQGFED